MMDTMTDVRKTRDQCLAADQLWALLSMRVQFANSDQLQAVSAAVRFGGLGRRPRRIQ